MQILSPIDAMFQGIYFGKSYHLPDVGSVLQRATENDVDKVDLRIEQMEPL